MGKLVSIANLSVDEASTLTADELDGISFKDICLYFEKNKGNGYLGIIYCYSSITSGKKYIGQTKSPYERHCTHVASSKIGSKRTDSNAPFYKAIRKEGFTNFVYNVLRAFHSCNLSEFRLMQDVAERHFISLYHTTDKLKGYNVNYGGISLPLGDSSYWARSVKQYSTHGVFIREYGCINEAARITKILASNICSVCSPNNPQKVAGGFLWTYSEDELDNKSIKHATRGIIHRYTIDGKYLDTFHSIQSAAQYVNGDRARILLCAQPPCIHISYGYRWSKERMKQLLSPPVQLNIEVHKYDKYGYYVASYNSQVEGARSINKSSSAHLAVCLKDLWRTAGGFYWRTFKTERIKLTLKPHKRYGKTS